MSVDLLHALLDSFLSPRHHIEELLVLFGIADRLFAVNFDFLSMELNFFDLGQPKDLSQAVLSQQEPTRGPGQVTR